MLFRVLLALPELLVAELPAFKPVERVAPEALFWELSAELEPLLFKPLELRSDCRSSEPVLLVPLLSWLPLPSPEGFEEPVWELLPPMADPLVELAGLPSELEDELEEELAGDELDSPASFWPAAEPWFSEPAVADDDVLLTLPESEPLAFPELPSESGLLVLAEPESDPLDAPVAAAPGVVALDPETDVLL